MSEKRYNIRPERRQSKTPEQAISSLMRLCSRSEKSSGDALRLMAGWGVAEEEKAGILRKLQDAGFIDDRRFAECYVRDKMSFSGWGRYKITRGLLMKGVGKDIIDEVLFTLQIDDPGEGRLYRLLEKKMSRSKYKDIYDLKGKLVRYAASQGYLYGEITETVEKLIRDKNIPDEQDI